MLDGIRSLREGGMGPPSPHLVYAELVRAMQREDVDVADLDDEPILWVGTEYVAPRDTLVGGKWLRAFEGICACVTEADSKALRSSYESLGARKQPDGRLWLALVVGIGQQFAVTRAP